MYRLKLFLSSTVLILSNLISLIGVVWYGWSLTLIVFLYWLENIVMGFYNILKMNKACGDNPSNLTINQKPAESYSRQKLIHAFIVSYGMFTLFHGLFTISLFGLPMKYWINVAMILFLMFVNHGISYLVHFINDNEYQEVSPGAQFNYPYRRLLVLHLTIILGAVAAGEFGTPIAALVTMVIIKITIDLITHNWEHLKIANKWQQAKSSITFPEKKSEAIGFLIILIVLFTYIVTMEALSYTKAPFGDD